MVKEFEYICQGKPYKTIVTYKRKMKNIRYVFRDDCFKISCPYYVSKARIKEGLDRFAIKLIANSEIRKKQKSNDSLFIFGEKIEANNFPLSISIKDTLMTFNNPQDMDKKLKKWFLNYMDERNRFYEKEMGIKSPYKVRIRNMTSRFGSNSKKTHCITYAMMLIHFSSEIIDSVIVHELAHYYEFNHSNKFYNVVYKYCPNYDELHRRLRKGIHQ